MSALYEIALTLIPGVGVVTSRLLLDQFGDAADVFKASRSQLMSIAGIGPKTADSILSKSSLDRAEEELLFVKKYKIQTLFYTSPDYPQRLQNCYDAPVLLYYKGNTDLNKSKVISIVGTRNATGYGKELTTQLIEGLQQHDVLVVSGLAYGIDVAAHRACMKYGVPTIGVVGHGLDRIYPSQHRSLAESMLGCGGLLTEFISQTKPDKENFPKRNRIVAGLSDATIIVEAGLKGGALITAELANSYDRDVMAYPGRVNDIYSAGCNFLIKSNRAHLVTGIKDVEYLLDWLPSATPKQVNDQLHLPLNLYGDEKVIVEFLKTRVSASLDELQLITNLMQSKLAMVLLNLEMQDIIVVLPGKMYRLR
ncbi:Rossmann fold nucleotide-binding protein Smf possibly involved in DNA uptake [Arcticibacter svalbardensis MN12-7]|uniref:Rossmann fold nucleotide-binding protein Smf possibly involved in DNA uptake n=1 Tax=Arcticibacter svalbardensis MN12-7 TaxID=1150600 RepID=R9GTC2_9SPHI|nr:DNA-processing protein DprA [Arcticibacter svalbardensis]EOR94943.1 Rossmann fold nucleotide-binding protein Smf possibly involved in DNA uptake [Arcticibacter svalbardensis MN12-7]